MIRKNKNVKTITRTKKINQIKNLLRKITIIEERNQEIEKRIDIELIRKKNCNICSSQKKKSKKKKRSGTKREKEKEEGEKIVREKKSVRTIPNSYNIRI